MKLLNNTFFNFIIFSSTLAFVFRDLLLNLNTNLIDWRDYPLMIWIMSQNVLKIKNLDFINYFDGNIFFPHKYTLLFSDLLLPQAIISLPLFVLSNNLVLIFNLVFIITFALNFISSYLFWRLLFKDNSVAFVGSLFIIFSPFLHLSLDHFQMLSYWPFFFSLYFLIKSEGNNKIKNILFSSSFLAIQFLASVYLAVFLIFSVGSYLLLKLIVTQNIKDFLKISLIILATFFIIDGIFIKGYLDVQNYYRVNRKVSEYINYSAHLTDYIFTTRINSFIHQSGLMNKWNNTDKNYTMGRASFPGFLLAILAFFSLFHFTKNKESFITSLEIDRIEGFFIVLIVCGLVFSLGPRLNFNGTYSGIPLPYGLLIKTNPLLESVRSPSRWSFIFYIGLIYFSLITIKRILSKKYNSIYAILILLLLALEYIPLNLTTEKGNVWDPRVSQLKATCSRSTKVLLELPLTHLDAGSNIAEGLTYINKVQLDSIYHRCNLVNGYSGYDLPDNFILADTLDKYIQNQDAAGFIKELKKRKIDLVKFNQKYFIKEIKPYVTKFMNSLETETGIEKVGTDIFSLPKIQRK